MRGSPLGLVRFELALASVRATAAAALGGEREVEIALVERASGHTILDTTRGVPAAGSSAQPAYELTAPRRSGHAHGRRPPARLSHADRRPGRARVGRGRREPQPSPFAATGISPGVLALLAVAVALAVAGAILLRQQRREHERILLEAEGGRAEAERRSRTDAQTGLYNRRHVVDAIAAELARSGRSGAPPSLLMLDIDHFSRINGVYGHAVGDRVLGEVATRVRGRLRSYDVLGRWGGEEFIVLAPGVPDDETLRGLADQIRRLVGALPIAIDDDTLLPVTVSVGAVRAGDALRTVEGLVDCASRALATAKRRGAIACSCSATSRSRISSPRSPSPSGWHER